MGCGLSSSTGQRPENFHQVWKLGRKIGEGAFGQVRLTKKRATDEERAVKIIDVRGVDSRYGGPKESVDYDLMKATWNEIKVWEALGSDDFIVELQCHFFEKNLFYMVMQKCDCSLMDKLSTMTSMTDKDVSKIFRHMLLGIRHVHEKRIVHRDVKPDNYLLGGPDGQNVKICDFGLAAQLPKRGLLKGVFGTAPYMSPEMLGSGGYGEKTDVWSFGSTAYLMIHGDFPYVPREASPAAMKKAIIAGKPAINFTVASDRKVMFSRDMVDRATPFLQALLQRSPDSRKSAQEALELPFLKVEEEKPAAAIVMMSEGGEEELPLARTFRKARHATKNMGELRRANPVQQRPLDELLTMLGEKWGDADAPAFFSEGEQQAEAQPDIIKTEKSDGRIHKRSQTRHCTHSGVLSSTTLGSLSTTSDLKSLQESPVNSGDDSTQSPPEDRVKPFRAREQAVTY